MKGVYVLVISVSKNVKVNIGKLGAVTFRKGFYAYVGSDQNNLEKRIARHLRRSKKLFWHIDYFLNSKYTGVAEVFWKETGKAKECETAKKMGGVGQLVPGFGSSDCSCKSHLVFLEDCEPSVGLPPFLRDSVSTCLTECDNKFACSPVLQ